MKVVEILSGLDGGGVENMLLNYCQYMERDKIHVDFIVHNQKKGAIENKFLEFGCKVFHVTPKTDSLLQNTYEIYKILKRENYDVVHSHMNYKGVSHMIIAKLCGVKCRIIHQHTAHYRTNGILKILVPIAKKTASIFSNVWMACSKDAAIDMFGKRNFVKKKVIILKDAIDTKKFSYNKVTRDKIRKEFMIDDKFVIGMVARFHLEKNHEFMIKIFKYILNIQKNSVLMLVGGGEMFEYYKKIVKEDGINNKVIFTGIRDDVGNLLQSMDAFVLPTQKEGFGMVLIESQCAGLPTFTSAEGVPKEVKVTDLLHFISLQSSAQEWANIILESIGKNERFSRQKEIIEAGYDIVVQKRVLEYIYENGYKKDFLTDKAWRELNDVSTEKW